MATPTTTEIPDSPVPSEVSGSEDGSSSSAPYTYTAVSPRIFFGAVANLCSATLGAGVLSLPFALYQAGLVCGLFLLLISAWATSASIRLLIEACDAHRLSTYEQVVERCLGRSARSAVEVSVLLFCVGCAVAYLIAVGDILEHVGHMPSSTRKLAMVVVWVLAMLPLSCLKRMQSLQCASTVGIISIGTLLAAAIVHLIQHPEQGAELGDAHPLSSLKPFYGPLHGSFMSVLRACPIVLFAFSCQVNVCQIYDEMPKRERNPPQNERVTVENGDSDEVEESIPQQSDCSRTMNYVTWTAVGVCCLLYTSISLVTLMDFGKDMKPNVLSCYSLGSGHDALLHIAFIAMAVAVVMAFPLNIFPARVSVQQIMGKHSRRSDVMCIGDEETRQPLLSSQEPLDQPVAEPTGEPLSTSYTMERDEMDAASPPGDATDEASIWSHMGVTLLVSGGALVLALLLPNISIVFGLLGGTTSSLLGFVVPGMLGLQMNKKDVSAWILVVAGTIVGVLTTAVTILGMIQDLRS